MPVFYAGQTDYIEKLNEIATGAGSTDISQGFRSGTTVVIISSTGANATLDSATTLFAGVMSAADKTKLDSALVSIGTDTSLVSYVLKDCSQAYFDSNTTNALNYTNGSMQRWAPNTGAQTLTVTNWPTTGLGELLIQGINLGAATITWPTINWVKSDGTFTTTFSSNGVTLQASGTDFIYLWSRDAGTTIYGKIIR